MRVERIGLATLYLGDCRALVGTLPRPDCVVTDPPYGTGGRRRATAGAGSNPAGSIVREAWDDGATDWLAWWPEAPVLTFWPSSSAGQMLAAAAASGRTKHRALYMHKRDPMPQFSGRVAWSVEPVWALGQDGFQLYGGTDLFTCSTPRAGRDADATGHPYEKPVECLAWLISKLRGARVICDPFMGSGTSGVAAVKAGLSFVGVEQDARWFDTACRRIEAAQRQSDLFVSAPMKAMPVDPYPVLPLGDAE
jgi:site-specific DNA-methyltransferase (adenine-specific)